MCISFVFLRVTNVYTFYPRGSETGSDQATLRNAGPGGASELLRGQRETRRGWRVRRGARSVRWCRRCLPEPVGFYSSRRCQPKCNELTIVSLSLRSFAAALRAAIPLA